MMGLDFGSLLQQYLGGGVPNSINAQEHFDQVSKNASPSLVSQGLSAMFHSE